MRHLGPVAAQTITVVVVIGTNLKFGDTKAVDTAAARRLWCGDGTAGVCEDCVNVCWMQWANLKPINAPAPRADTVDPRPVRESKYAGW